MEEAGKEINLKEVLISGLIGGIIWSIFGVINCGIWYLLLKISGYTYGILPGFIIGFLIGIITGIWGSEVGSLAGAIIASLGNFFNVATLKNPLPVDVKIYSLNIRAPIFVAIPGGILGAISSILVEKIKEKILKK